MPKLYPARVILSALQRAGFSIVSQKGSHIKLTKREKDKIYTVIVPFHKEIAFGTFNSILRQAGMTKEEFQKFLITPNSSAAESGSKMRLGITLEP
jgi:predicted RNA binding protein YcfA (HicA-like mRNA interferase family)